MVAAVLANVGNLDAQLERFSDALPVDRRVLATQERALGADAPMLAMSIGYLAEALAGTGAADEADALSSRELAIGAKLPPDNYIHRLSFIDHGSVLFHTGRCREAVPVLEQAVQLYDQYAADDVLVGYPLEQLGRCLLSLGRTQEAETALERALTRREKDLPAGHYLTGQTVEALAEVDLAAGRAPRARERAERAVAVLAASEHTAAQARARYTLARTLAPTDLKTARAQATSARNLLQDFPALALRRDVEQWLAARP
jgi:tetratricopeptide (TPR) repeat protein